MRKAALNGIMTAVATLVALNAVPASAQHTAEQGLLNRSLSSGWNFGAKIQSVTAFDTMQESVDGARALLGITSRAGGAATEKVEIGGPALTAEQALLGAPARPSKGRIISRSRQQRTPGVAGEQALLGRTEGDSREATVSPTAGADPTYPSSEQALLGRVRDLIGATGGSGVAWYTIESGEVALLGKR